MINVEGKQPTITPEKVWEFLEGVTLGKWYVPASDEPHVKCREQNDIFGKKVAITRGWSDAEFIASAPAIAQAYLEKCEEVERLQAIIDKQLPAILVDSYEQIIMLPIHRSMHCSFRLKTAEDEAQMLIVGSFGEIHDFVKYRLKSQQLDNVFGEERNQRQKEGI